MRHLDTLRQRGHTLALTAEGKVFHRGPKGATDEIREHLDEIKAALRAEASATAAHPGSPTSLGEPEDATAREAQDLDLHAPDVSEHLPDPGMTTRAGSDETRELIAWFEAARPSLPSEPFTLASGLMIVEPERFYHFLEGWIEESRDCRDSSLTVQLRRLRQHFEGEA